MAIATDKSAVYTPVSTVSRKKGWADLDLSLKRHPIQKDIIPLKDDKAIRNAVKNLVLTNFYERPFQHSKGANLSGLLFEPADMITAYEIKESIREVITYYEPRVIIRGVNVLDDLDQNAWIINIRFLIKNINIETNVEVLLRRTR
jgi:phage baseplate assembly protein W|tara:strand:+ start:84 stop:521 length:438 start_codon:yes stop_codon:yes gene_type:complete